MLMRDTTRGVSLLAAVVLVLVLGLGLLYAYRSQAPAMEIVPVTTLIAQVQQGRVKSVAIEDGRATATLVDARQQQAQLPGNGEDLTRAIEDYNRAGPARPIELRYNTAPPGIFVIFPVLLWLLPVLLIFALIQFAASAFARARAPQRYEDLSRLADLRDRGVVTEEEFQREKRRILK